MHAPASKHIKHVLVPHPYTDTLMLMGKNVILRLSEVEKEEGRKEKWTSTVCQKLQCFISALSFNSYILFLWFKWPGIITFILNIWKLMPKEVKWFPRSHNYQQMHPVCLIISRFFLLCHTASLFDCNYSRPFYKYALIYSQTSGTGKKVSVFE